MHAIAIDGRADFLGLYYQTEGNAAIIESMNIPDNLGRLPIHYAAGNGYLDVLQCILELCPTLANATNHVIFYTDYIYRLWKPR